MTEELRARSKVPGYLKAVLDALPVGTHPMTQFSMLVMALQVSVKPWKCGWWPGTQRGWMRVGSSVCFAIYEYPRPRFRERHCICMSAAFSLTS